jgi:hypothetical protein
MLHSLFYLETALRVSGGTNSHHQERKQLYLQHLVFVTPLLLFAAIVEKLELHWFCLIPNLNETLFDGLWHYKDTCPTYCSLKIDLGFGPLYLLTEYGHGVFPCPAYPVI